MRYSKKWLALPIAVMVLLAAGCGTKDVNDVNETTVANDEYVLEAQEEFDYKCYELSNLSDLYEVIEESKDRLYICDYEEYCDICAAIGKDCTYDNEDMKYVIVANQGQFIKGCMPVRFVMDGNGETSLYVHEKLQFAKQGSSFIAAAYVMVFPVSNEIEDLTVYFCTSQEVIRNMINAINEENTLF